MADVLKKMFGSIAMLVGLLIFLFNETTQNKIIGIIVTVVIGFIFIYILQSENNQVKEENIKLINDNKELEDNRAGLIEQIKINEKEIKKLKNDIDKLYLTNETYRTTYERTINDVSSTVEDKIIRSLSLIRN